jgi:ADP-ribose pyrophosphatase
MTRLSRRTIYTSPWVNLHVDRVQVPNGQIIECHHLVDFESEAVASIMVNAEGKVALINQYRYCVDKNSWELPAGGIEPGETIPEAASREILEETGFTCSKPELIYTYNPLNGISNAVFHILCCQALDKQGEPDLTEVDSVGWFSPDEIGRMIQDQIISCGYTLTSLLLWLHRRAV